MIQQSPPSNTGDAQEIGALMCAPTEAPTPERVLEDGLCAYFGRQVRISEITRRPFDYRSTYPIERLHVTLESGEELKVIFKRIMPSALPESGQFPKLTKGDKREVLVYEKLLRGSRFGTPSLYASLYDEKLGHYWLFLEDVGDRTLDTGEMGDWRAAIRWLAGMHATYLGREDELRALNCLGDHETAYYVSIARAVPHTLSAAGAHDALARFDKLMQNHNFDAVAERLANCSRTLVHGDIFPHNIAIQRGSVIRPLDWEAAAIGAPAWDLVRLLDGWGSDKPAFIAAYFAELERCGSPLSAEARDTFTYTFHNHCRIVNILWHLRWSVEDCQDQTFVNEMLDKLDETWRVLEGGRA